MMREKLIKFVLGLAQVAIDLGIVATFFTAFATVIAGICCLVSPRTFLGGHLTINLVIQGLVVVIVAALAFAGLLATHRLLDNLNRGHYFVAANCQALQQLLWLEIAGLIISGITTIWLRLVQVKPFVSFIVMTEDNFSDGIGFIVFLLIIYLIFKRGIALQQDADNII